ncbi:MAG: biotin-dependent carboxyltransferase family protein [Opitutales bacterium]
MMSVEILSIGSGMSLQDAGRFGWLRYGVPPGGVMDSQAMKAANKLLGNRRDAPVLEIRLQGAVLKVLEEIWLALAGAPSCRGFPSWTARLVNAGEVLEFSKKASAVFAYIAVPGGFAAERNFGSVSVDPRIGLGAPLRKGDFLIAATKKPNVDITGIARRILNPAMQRNYTTEPQFSLLPGPQFDNFSEEAREQLVASKWVVSPQCDRTGYRLEGPRLEVPHSIPSEPVLPGSFQVPSNGLPIVTMVDGPTVGGYPKIAVLPEVEQERLAQCTLGTQLSFKWSKY